jgi:hypothetical protein
MGQGMNLMMARIRQVLWRSRAYKRLFMAPGSNELSEDGRIVVAHLKRFARLGKPPASPGAQVDMFQVGRMVGRQETVQMIVEALHLDERTLTNLQEDFRDE